MKDPRDKRSIHDCGIPEAASELNNLLQIVAGTVSMLENICEGAPESEKYFQMLRTSLARAANVTSRLVQIVGGTEQKILFHPTLTASAKAPAPPPPLRVSRCILVVDDEPMALALTQDVLSRAGYTVVAAQSGFEALDLFQKDPAKFSLVLLDLSMPLMDGEETFDRMRALDPNVLVLLNTGFIETHRLSSMMKRGLAGFLRRPYQPSEVIQQIEALLAGAAARRRLLPRPAPPAPVA